MARSSLHSAAEFERVVRDGQRARRDGVTVHVAPAAARAESPSRLGLAVRCKGAVDRNLLKRRLRSAWRSYKPAAGYDAAVRAGDGALGLQYQELENQLHGALRAAGLGSDR